MEIPSSLALLLERKRIVADDFHFHRLGAGRHGLSYAPQAHDAQRLACQLRAHVLLAVPATFDQAVVGRVDVSRQGEHEDHGVLGRGDGVPSRRVHDHDPQSRGGIEVDVVGSNARPGDGLQAPVAFEHVPCDLRAAAADCAVEIGQRASKVVASQPHLDVVVDVPGGFQQVQPVLRQVVQYDDSCHPSDRSWLRVRALERSVGRRRDGRRPAMFA